MGPATLIVDPIMALPNTSSNFLGDKEEILTEQQRAREQGSKDFPVALPLHSIFLLPEGYQCVQKHPGDENTVEIADGFDMRRSDLAQSKA